MTERDVILNELAQGLRPMSRGIEWFDAHDPQEQSEVLLFLRHYCMQARAVTEDGPESIRRAGLRPTHTPAVLITRGPIDQQLGKIVGLTPSTNAARRSGYWSQYSRSRTNGAANGSVPTDAVTGGTRCPSPMSDSESSCRCSRPLDFICTKTV